ncbi:MAG: nucleotidyltransferase domain-containing protein [Lachnospiraceae bacterium]|nr:nucleotidyltransferase domain-containing protein [Lachnospiraceae bacterium]
MKTFNNFELHFIFDLKNENIDFLNAEYIHPLKQELVQNLQADFERDENVRAVIVFGSAVEFRCNSYSDLDLCVERCHFDRPFRYNALDEIDLLYWDRIGEKLKQEIAEKGIVVFDREGKYV